MLKETVQRDERLRYITLYDLTHGFLLQEVDAEELQKKFIYNKMAIRRGEFTFEWLEEKVAERWGTPVYAPKPQSTKTLHDLFSEYTLTLKTLMRLYSNLLKNRVLKVLTIPKPTPNHLKDSSVILGDLKSNSLVSKGGIS